ALYSLSLHDALPILRMIDLSRVRGALWLAPVALTMAACDGMAPKASQPVSLSVTTKGTGSGIGAAIQIGSGANSLTINQAQVVRSEEHTSELQSRFD